MNLIKVTFAKNTIFINPKYIVSLWEENMQCNILLNDGTPDGYWLKVKESTKELLTAIESEIDFKLPEYIQKLKLELKQYKCSEKFPNQCHCAFRCLDGEFCDAADKKISELKSQLQAEKQKVKGLKNRLKTLDDETLTVEITQEEFEKYSQYKQALEEIKSITLKCHYALIPFHQGNTFAHECADMADDFLNKILQKCEVLEG